MTIHAQSIVPNRCLESNKIGGRVIELERLIGRKVNLIPLKTTSQAFDVELVECFRNNVLLVSQPNFIPGQPQLHVGQTVQIRFELNNIIYCYHTKVIRFCNNAQLCLQMLIPGTDTQNNLSRQQRVKVRKKEIKIMLQDGKQKIPVSVADISVNGACLVADTRLGKINEELSIELTITEGSSSIRLPCKIRYVRTEYESTLAHNNISFHHGVKFLQLATNAENFLLRFVS